MIDQARFFALVAKLSRGYVPPCWLVAGVRVTSSADKNRVFTVLRWKSDPVCRSGVRVWLQRLVGKPFSIGAERDLWHLSPVVSPEWPDVHPGGRSLRLTASSMPRTP